MSRLFQIQLSNGSAYITREFNEEEFYKSRMYKLRRGCIVKNVIAKDGWGSVQLFSITDNTFFDVPIIIQSNNINEIKFVKKNSDLEKLYLKVTSGIILN